MPEVKITKRVVDAAEPRETRYAIFDSVIPGFGLRVFPTGAKSWIFEYRAGAGARSADKKRITIGRVGDFTPDQARREAERLRSSVKMGNDPHADKAAERAAPTVADIAQAFLADHVAEKRGEGTYKHYKDLLERIILPAVGKIKAQDLDTSQVAKLHRDWKSTPYQANRILAVISSMYRYAGSTAVKMVPRGTNPSLDIERYEEKGREVLLSGAQLADLGDALRIAATTGIPWKVRPEKADSKHLAATERRVTVFGEHVVAAFRLYLFTGARLREILNLEWRQVDLERGLLLLDKHKTSRTTGTKTIVLNAPAMAVLENVTRIGRYVIAGDAAGTPEEKPRTDLKKPWLAIKRHAGMEHLRIHDLRHNFASFGVGGGMGLPVVGKLLGHTQTRTTERYAHLHSDPLRKASDTIGADITAALGDLKRTSRGG